MPARKVPKNYRNVTGIVASSKAEGAAEFESTLERDFLTLLEFSPDVERFEVQPVTLGWHDGTQDRRYTPDVLVYPKRSGKSPTVPVLYEVKYRDDLRESWQALRPRFRAATRFARAQGWRFKLISDREIRTTYLANARFLLPYVRQGPPTEADMNLLDVTLDGLQEASVEQLLQAACQDPWNRARLLPTAWYLVGTFYFGVDLHQPLTMHSTLRIRK